MEDAIQKLRIPRFRGIFLRENLPRKTERSECGILKLDDTSGKGTHWVAWYRRNGKNFYFGS